MQRFSEDIDITVFREDIGEDASVEALAEMASKLLSRKPAPPQWTCNNQRARW
ncbi:MAG: hypothetical protein QM605_03615 [Sphingobium sp.]